MVRTAIQLQTLESLPEGLQDTIARVGETALDGVEFAGIEGATPVEIADALDDADLEPIGAHVQLDALEQKYDDIIAAYETIGCRRLIESGRHVESFTSVEAVEAFVDRLETVANRLQSDGFELLYHNDMIEFDTLENEVAFNVFTASLDQSISLEIDTGLAQYAGVDPLSLLSQHAGRVPLVHLTDSVPGGAATLNVELGAGELDVNGCVETARNSDVEWIVYEHSMTSDPIDSLTHAETRLSYLCHGADGTGLAQSVSTTD
ncbi:sugar phosphate isomerase/epimerase family protein [Natrialbaceae archaeon A-CW2]|uniref:sugar phosphate isomerase/epimerase family protein n=1 Tax=Natronosalvus amylolyticus TaxID=2961994 RepID=UPI0020CA08BE|nr:sugar phosphate isomerase/epimerase [Natronosalvus amylolyticus]